MRKFNNAPHVIKNLIKDAVKKIFVDGIAAAIIWAVNSLWGNIFGASVLALLLVGLSRFIIFLQIPVTLPAYIVAIFIVVVMVLGLIVSRRSQYLKKRRDLFSGFSWLRSPTGEPLGPLCPLCDSIIESDGFESTDNGMIYRYKCSKCDYKVNLDWSPHELKNRVRTVIGEFRDLSN